MTGKRLEAGDRFAWCLKCKTWHQVGSAPYWDCYDRLIYEVEQKTLDPATL